MEELKLNAERVLFHRDEKLYGHFIEHFHRQIYGGIYDPASPQSDEDGFRMDILEAMRRIHVPILRWPGGCFVSAYHWKNAVGPVRTPFFDKAWRVEDPATFGTAEYIRLCRKIGCEPYICTNAGTGSPEEMSDWLEYCNLESEGEYARLRIAHGHREPYDVKFWSIGNENYGFWEIGAKGTSEWSRYVCEAAKMMQRVDPTVELSAAALADIDWNMALLRQSGPYLSWISIHKYWNLMAEDNDFADYMQSMAYTDDLETDISKVRGLLMAFGLQNQIRIACDEWNLRGWHHPKTLSIVQGRTKEEYLNPRNKNDRNQDYTMADAVFTACFLNTLNRNADIVGMACFAPVVNTRGCIYSDAEGIVLRSTYHVYDLYVNYLYDGILDIWQDKSEFMSATGKDGKTVSVPVLDILATRDSKSGCIAVAAVNKHPQESRTLTIQPIQNAAVSEYRIVTVNGADTEAYNDHGHTAVALHAGVWIPLQDVWSFTLEAHSVNVIQMK